MLATRANKQKLVVLWDNAKAASSFLPSDIAGLVAWFDFSDISTLYQDSGKTTPVTADGDPIGAVEDKSGNGNDVTQATTANKPTYKTGVQNGLSAALFDGGDMMAGALSGALSQPVSAFMSTALDASVINNGIYYLPLDSDDSVNRLALFYADAASNPDAWSMFVGVNLSSSTATNAAWNYFSALVNGATSEMWLNGTSIATGDAGVHDADGLTLGARFGASAYWFGHIGELCVYDPSLSDSDRGLLENYLTRWA